MCEYMFKDVLAMEMPLSDNFRPPHDTFFIIWILAHTDIISQK